jgi:hypothetical protein
MGVTMDDMLPAWKAARELRVSDRMVWDFLRAGHLKGTGGMVTRESVDDLKWHVALAAAEKQAVEAA